MTENVSEPMSVTARRYTDHWKEVHVYQIVEGDFVRVRDLKLRAKALVTWRDKRVMPDGFSLIPLRLIDDTKEHAGEPVLHRMSLLVYAYVEGEDRFERVTRPFDLDYLTRKFQANEPVPGNVSIRNRHIDYSGIDLVLNSERPFNPPRFERKDK